MTTYRKKLIEVALPLIEISEAAAQEQDVKTGKPSNLHAWWSRKPMSAARAVLLASIIDDPADGLPEDSPEAQQARRDALQLVADVARWDGRHNPDMANRIDEAIRASVVGPWPVVLDPFCGGGTIPLEGKRLRLGVEASDLNPVAVLITRAMVELLPEAYGKEPVHPSNRGIGVGSTAWTGLEQDVRRYAEDIAQLARRRLAGNYPDVDLGNRRGGGTAEPVGWVWARTVRCPNPRCTRVAPLTNKFWVSTHRGNEAWVKVASTDGADFVTFTVEEGKGAPLEGTVTRSGATCLHCGSPISFEHVRAEGKDGALGSQLMTTVISAGGRRVYLSPDAKQENSASTAVPPWQPETSIPERALGFRVQNYGITEHRHFFTARQLLAIGTMAELVREIRAQILHDAGGDEARTNAIQVMLAFAVSRLAQTNNSLVRWRVRASGTSKGECALDRPIVPMTWEFYEGNVFGESVGSWTRAVENPLSALRSLPPGSPSVCSARQMDAASLVVAASQPVVVSMDPPYSYSIRFHATA